MSEAKPVLIAAALIAAAPLTLPSFAQAPASAPPATASRMQIGNFGGIDVYSTSSSYQGNQGVYRNAHMVAGNGTTLDADTIQINFGQGTSALQNVVADGHVKAYLAQPEVHRTYTITAAKGVYNPANQQIDLTGNVKTVITSPYTTGPLVQTGDSGTIKLGPAPDYPQITMNDVHTTFTPQR